MCYSEVFCDMVNLLAKCIFSYSILSVAKVHQDS